MLTPTIHPIPFQTCPELIDFLENLDSSVMKLGTDRVEKLLAAMGAPQNQVKTIHIAGTNGKGSVCAILASIYHAAGYRVGLFTSPHLVDMRERIQLENSPISPDMFLEAAQVVYLEMIRVFPQPEEWLTYFEFINVMAFWRFAQQRVDIALIETGLGGRLDSTNVIEKPEATVITSISMDHMERLGNTLPEIAYEKAGILKRGVPALTVSQEPSVTEVLRFQATRRNAPLVELPSRRYRLAPCIHQESKIYRQIEDTQTGEHYDFSLLGRYQEENLNLALYVIQYLQRTLPLSNDAIRRGLMSVHWPGRFQYFRDLNLVIDGSHNPAGLESLLETLSLDFSEIKIHWGISLLANRPITSVLPLMSYKQSLSVHFLQAFPPERFHTPSTFAELPFNTDHMAQVTDEMTPQAFCTMPSRKGELKLLTGSLYTAGYALKSLQENLISV